ncbi:hypothetical protein [Breoghania sp.]|uniref:hypothetical protein n=1 Tax=Breoghania sp. TaxID=2065378 RepID=UPI0026354A6D|nr:hypothetical protein [Breoghania sp.]MDJ0932060.1 hypothetical protein [Breoghania sp.]
MPARSQGGLKTTSDAAAERLSAAQTYFDKQTLHTVQYNPTPLAERILNWLHVANPEIQTKRVTEMRQWFTDEKVDLGEAETFYGYILSGNTDSTVLQRAIDHFSIP